MNIEIPEIKRFNIIDKLQFQDLIADVFNYRDNVNSYINHGRNGQKQNSIDVSSNEKQTVIQCKYKQYKDNTEKNRAFIKKEIIKEVESFKNSNYREKHFIYATTFDHDAEIQKFCSEYQENNKLPFALSYFGWQEIEKIIVRDQNILKKYFPQLMIDQNYIEILNIEVDSQNCSWIKDDDFDYVFWDTPSEKSPFPIFDFSFFNNSINVVVLSEIRLKIKNLYSGLSGLPTEISVIKPFAKYEIFLDKKREYYKPKNFEPIGISPNYPFRLQIQVFNQGKDCYYELSTRYLFYFEFYFNNNLTLKSPALYLNTKNENDTIEIRFLH